MIELLITLALLGMVITALYTFYLAGLRSWYRSVERMEYQQTARIAMEKIIDELLFAELAELRHDNQAMVYYITRRHGSPALFRFRFDGHQLHIEQRTSNDTHLSSNVVALGLTGLVFHVAENGAVAIELEAGNEEIKVTLNTKVYPRNMP